MIDIRGKLLPDRCGDRFTWKDGLGHLTLVPAGQSATGQDLGVTQADLDSLVRSKAAMYTILETITGSVGMQPQDLETFFVAGTFGAYIDPASAITIGMLPDLPLARYHSLGNSSLGGATRVLENPACFDRDQSHPRRHHLHGVEREPGLYEPLLRSQVPAPHRHLPVPFGSMARCMTAKGLNRPFSHYLKRLIPYSFQQVVSCQIKP